MTKYEDVMNLLYKGSQVSLFPDRILSYTDWNQGPYSLKVSSNKS